MAIFDSKNQEHKAQLYRAIVEAAELANIPFDTFLQIPFDPPWALAADYRRNLSRGTYSTARARVLYDFMLNQHFDVAHRTAPDIVPDTPERRWRAILDEQAITGQLKIVQMKVDLGIVQRADAIDAAETTIKLNQPFCFELDSDHDGYAIALQGLRNSWHPIELGPNGNHRVPIATGSNLFPIDADGQPHTISEDHDLGLHEFVVVSSMELQGAVGISELIKMTTNNRLRINHVHVQFVQ